MTKFNILKTRDTEALPRGSGVYSFLDKENVLLYIGKSANIKDRVKNHFLQPNHRDAMFLDKIAKIGYIETFSEIEALILEAQLIKGHQPRFNILWRDDKNYFYVAIENNRVFITHQPKRKHIGPFVDGKALKKTLLLLRKIFPFYSVKKHSPISCLYCHLKLCPGPKPDIKKCNRDLRNLTAVLQGKKQSVLKDIKRQMQMFSRAQEFEKAAGARNKLFSLGKIMSNARIFEERIIPDWSKTEELLQKILKIKKIRRIEGYDVSNIQGKQATASMVVFENGLPNKDQYRKFKIRLPEKPNDIAMLKEALERRFSHPEWSKPDVILIDGGKAQLNVAIKVKTNGIKALALAKRNNELYIEGKKYPILLKNLDREIFNLILQIRDESHRFAITYHKKLRKKHLLYS